MFFNTQLWYTKNSVGISNGFMLAVAHNDMITHEKTTGMVTSEPFIGRLANWVNQRKHSYHFTIVDDKHITVGWPRGNQIIYRERGASAVCVELYRVSLAINGRWNDGDTTIKSNPTATTDSVLAKMKIRCKTFRAAGSDVSDAACNPKSYIRQSSRRKVNTSSTRSSDGTVGGMSKSYISRYNGSIPQIIGFKHDDIPMPYEDMIQMGIDHFGGKRELIDAYYQYRIDAGRPMKRGAIARIINYKNNDPQATNKFIRKFIMGAVSA